MLLFSCIVAVLVVPRYLHCCYTGKLWWLLTIYTELMRKWLRFNKLVTRRTLDASYNISLVYHVHFIYYICLLNNKRCMHFVVLYVLISVQYEQTHKTIHLLRWRKKRIVYRDYSCSLSLSSCTTAIFLILSPFLID